MWSTRSPASVVRCTSFGETQRRLETQVKEHRDACNKGDTGEICHCRASVGSATSSELEVTRMLERASRPVQLRVKETLHIQKTPTNNRLNCDEGYELPGCWIATVKKIGGGVSSSCASANRISAWTSAPDRMCTQASRAMPINCHHFAPRFTFALKMTRASSRNVGKLYTEH